MILFERLNEFHDLFLDKCLVVFTVNIIHASIDGENLDSFLPGDPLLMSFMDGLNVFQTDLFLSFSVSDLYSLKTNFRRTFQVDNALDRTVLNERMTE